MNRIDRLMATILLLQGRRVVTAEEIAGHFEISLRTVYRDMAALSEGGVPIVAEAGVGYSLLNGYTVPPVMFTPEEASALFLGGELVEHLTDASLQTQMRSALLKIRSVLPRAHQDRLDRLKRTTALLVASPAAPESDRAVLTRIQGALAQRRVVELRYRTKGEGPIRSREVEPLGLVFYADHWHLIGHCRLRRDFRDFRTDRITGLVVRDEVFQGHPDFSLKDHINAQRDRHEGLELVLRVASPVADRFRRAWMGAIVAERIEGEHRVFTVLGGECDWLVGWLLSFGTGLEVVSPDSLRIRMADQAARLAAHHGAGEHRRGVWEPVGVPALVS